MKQPPGLVHGVRMAFVGAIAVACVLCAAVWKVASDAADAARQVAHTHSVISTIAQVRGDTLQIELATQGFRMSGTEAYLQERDLAMARREAGLLRLLGLLEGFPLQRERWATLRALIDERIVLSRKIEQLRRQEGADAAAAFVASAPLRETRERTHTVLSEMGGHEEARLDTLVHAQEATRRALVYIVVALAVLLAVFLGVTYRFIRRQLRVSEADRQAVIASERNLSLTLHAIGDGMLATDARGHIVRMNAVAERLCGVPMAGAGGQHIDAVVCLQDASGAVHAGWLPQHADAPYAARGLVLTSAAGGRFTIALHATQIRGPANEVLGAIVIFRDETELIAAQQAVERHNEMLESTVQTRTREIRLAEAQVRELNAELGRRVRELEHVSRALRTLSAGNRAMLRAVEEPFLLQDMCHAIVEAGGYGMAIVWYREEGEDQPLRPVAESGYPGGLKALQALRTTWADNERGRGTAALATRTGRTTVVSDMQADPRYAPWRPFLHGNASSIGCPLRLGATVIGALTIYDKEPDTFDADEVTLLTESADDLAFGIATLRSRAEEAHAKQAMHRLSHFDALTGLANETQFIEALVRALDSDDRPLCVVQFNIERLREINEALGFAQGDLVLQTFARHLEHAAGNALASRLRADEFAVLLPQADRTAALALADRVRTALRIPVAMGELQYDIGVRIGVVAVEDRAPPLPQLMRQMDIAVREARARAIDCVVFEPGMDTDHEQPRRLQLAGELRRGIASGELRLFVQPKIDMGSGTVCGVEGLVRWQHPVRGLVPPGDFIQLAEQTGLIKPLTDWVIGEGFRIAHQWKDQGLHLPIALNLSAQNLRDPLLIDSIRRHAARHDVEADRIEFELTESAVMGDGESSLAVLQALRALGYRLYIDDFGTGYSSLTYLQRLPIDSVKIDQSFVRGVAAQHGSAAIVRSTIDLVHDLGKKTVAEGVETEADWQALLRLGCDSAQGYLIARPMPHGDLPGWLQRFPHGTSRGFPSAISGGGPGGRP